MSFSTFYKKRNKICITKSDLVDNITYMKGEHPK